MRPLAHLTAISMVFSSIQAYISDGSLSSRWIQDVSLGLSSLPLGYSLAIGPLLLLIAHTLAVAVALMLQVLVSSLSASLRLTRLSSLAVWGPPQPSRMQVKPASWIGTGVVLVLVTFLVPYQFVFLVAFVVQLVTAIRSQHSLHTHVTSAKRSSTDESSDEGEEEGSRLMFESTRTATSLGASKAAQHLLLLNVLFWLLPLKAPVLIVWVHNLLMGWRNALGGEDHNPLRVLAVLLLTQVASSGRVLERAQTK